MAHNRKDAGERTAAFLWAWTGGLVIVLTVVTIGLVWMLVDLVIQATTDRDVLTTNSAPAKAVRGTIWWWSGQLSFALVSSNESGKGFKLIPEPYGSG